MINIFISLGLAFFIKIPPPFATPPPFVNLKPLISVFESILELLSFIYNTELFDSPEIIVFEVSPLLINLIPNLSGQTIFSLYVPGSTRIIPPFFDSFNAL